MSHSQSVKMEFASPDGLFRKKVVKAGLGFFVPIDGAVCKTEAISDEYGLLRQLDANNSKEIIIGEADDHVDFVIESGLSTMKEQEVAEIFFLLPSSAVKKPLPNSPLKEEAKQEKYLDDIDEMKSPLIEEERDLDLASSRESVNKREDIVEKRENCRENELDNKVCQDIIDDSDKDKDVVDLIENPQDVVVVEKSAHLDHEISSTTSDQDEIELKSFCDGVPVEKVSVTIRLICFTRQPEIWEMSVTEKWRRATRHKERGVELYARGRHGWAFRRFSVAIRYLISVEHDIPPEHLEKEVDVKGLKLSCYLNIAACHLKKPNYELAAKVCSKALELDAYNAKALYRRATAFIHLQDYEKAEEDLKRAAELEPANSAIVKQQKVLKGKVHKLNTFYAKAMKKMFT